MRGHLSRQTGIRVGALTGALIASALLALPVESQQEKWKTHIWLNCYGRSEGEDAIGTFIVRLTRRDRTVIASSSISCDRLESTRSIHPSNHDTITTNEQPHDWHFTLVFVDPTTGKTETCEKEGVFPTEKTIDHSCPEDPAKEASARGRIGNPH